MVTLLRKIRRSLISAGRLRKYLLYGTGEILLVVIGILIAIQVNNLNNKRQEAKQARQIYLNIGDQIREDRNELLEAKGVNNYFSSSYAYMNSIIYSSDKSKVDTLAYLVLGLSQYSDFRRGSNIYETLVNSGDIKLLHNEAVTNGLQKLEIRYNHINQLEEIHWEVIITELSPLLRGVVNYATLVAVKPEALFDVEMQNMVIESLFLTKAKDSVYNHAIRDIEMLLSALEEVN